jgi:hypothetical protein
MEQTTSYGFIYEAIDKRSTEPQEANGVGSDTA